MDKSKKNYIEGVRVMSTSGKIAFSDSLGHYKIKANYNDSIYFVYNNKPTQKFTVNTIPNYSQFDISLHNVAKSNNALLQEVIVFAKNHKQDSIENRLTYAEAFYYHKPRVETSIVPGGGVGMDANELINMFRFKRNKRLETFQKRLETQEQEKYIDYRFNKKFVHRITQLSGKNLDTFMVWYKPSYNFASTSSLIDFNQYILNASYSFKRMMGIGEAKKEEITDN